MPGFRVCFLISVNPRMSGSSLIARIFPLVLTIVIGAALGLGSAWWSVRNGGPAQSRFQVGPWEGSLLAGSTDADLYTRARVAVVGLLALDRRETVYYIARTDSAGQALRSRCQYRIDGVAPPARWWSLTAYAEDHFLFDAAQGRFSLNGALATLDAQGAFHLWTGPIAITDRGADHWLPTPGDRGLELTLRLYHPSEAVQQNPQALSAPTIERVGTC